MESHRFSKDRRLNQYIHFEMLLYIHTQLLHTYTGLQKQTSQLKCSQPGTSASSTPPKALRAMPHCSHHRVPLHGLLTRERQNVKMLAREQLRSYSCLFFLLKKPLNVEVLGSPHKKSREHHQSQGSRAGADRPRSARPSRLRKQPADSKRPSSSRLLQVWFPTIALAPNHSLLQKSVYSGQWRLILKGCAQGTPLT